MAKVTEIEVGVMYRKGFVNSYSSVETTYKQRITLEPGDNISHVRQRAMEGCRNVVVAENESFVEEHDRPLDKTMTDNPKR